MLPFAIVPGINEDTMLVAGITKVLLSVPGAQVSVGTGMDCETVIVGTIGLEAGEVGEVAGTDGVKEGIDGEVAGTDGVKVGTEGEVIGTGGDVAGTDSQGGITVVMPTIDVLG